MISCRFANEYCNLFSVQNKLIPIHQFLINVYKMSFQSVEVNINNVYDFAYDIAQEFEKLVFLYGIDKIKPIVDKVILVLETLESSIKKYEMLEAEARDLKSSNFQLSSEKLVSDHEKLKLKQIYEESEESWLAEVAHLKSQLSLLKTENDSLRNRSVTSENLQPDNTLSVIKEQENVICNLKHVIKQKDKQLQDKICSINNLNVKIQELLKLNKSHHKKNQEAKNDISKLLLEKNEYRSELMQAKRENLLLRESVEEFIQSSLHSQGSYRKGFDSELAEEMLDETPYRRNDMKILEKIKILQCELEHFKFKFQGSEDVCNPDLIENKTSFSKIQQFPSIHCLDVDPPSVVQQPKPSIVIAGISIAPMMKYEL